MTLMALQTSPTSPAVPSTVEREEEVRGCVPAVPVVATGVLLDQLQAVLLSEEHEAVHGTFGRGRRQARSGRRRLLADAEAAAFLLALRTRYDEIEPAARRWLNHWRSSSRSAQRETTRWLTAANVRTGPKFPARPGRPERPDPPAPPGRRPAGKSRPL